MPNQTIPSEAQNSVVEKVTDSALKLADSYSDFSVSDPLEFSLGADHLKHIKTAQKALAEERVAITRPMDEAKNRVMSFFKQFSDRLNAAEAHVKKGLTVYSDNEKMIADANARREREKAEREERRLREEARKADAIAAEKERRRLAEEQRKVDERAAIEDERIQKEKAAAKTEEDARRVIEQEAAAKVRREKEQERLHQERLQSEADQRERSARAETLESRADATAAAPVVSAAPKVDGISTRKKWVFEITNASLIPDKYKSIDEKKIGGIVRAMKSETDIPGIRVWWETVMSARAK